MHSRPGAALELVPEAEWEIWHQDTFDMQCPRRVELAGRGLVKGLMELWARHLREAVQPDGRLGFSQFNLWWKQAGRSLAIPDRQAGQARLKQWVFGTTEGEDLLPLLAAAHCRLALTDQAGEAILLAAEASTGRQAFEHALAEIV